MSDSARLQTDLVRLVDQGRRPDKTLAPRAPAAAIPSSAGVSRPSTPIGSASEGISSPLVEADAAARTYHTPETTLTPSDGLFTIKISHPETFTLTDSQGRTVELTLDAP